MNLVALGERASYLAACTDALVVCVSVLQGQLLSDTKHTKDPGDRTPGATRQPDDWHDSEPRVLDDFRIF